MSRASTLGVSVRDHQGVPIGEAVVAVSKVAFADVPEVLGMPEGGLPAGGAPIFCAVSSVAGTASFGELESGSYFVGVRRPGYITIRQSFQRCVSLAPGVTAVEVVMAPLVGAARRIVGDELVSYSTAPTKPGGLRTRLFGDVINRVQRRIEGRFEGADFVIVDVPEDDGDTRVEVELLFAASGRRRMFIDLVPIAGVVVQDIDPQRLELLEASSDIARASIRLLSGSDALEPHGLMSLVLAGGAGSSAQASRKDALKKMSRSIFPVRGRSNLWLPEGTYTAISSDPLLQQHLRGLQPIEFSPSAGPIDVCIPAGYVIRQCHVYIDGVMGVGGGRIRLFLSEGDAQPVRSVFLEDADDYVLLPTGRLFVSVQVGGLVVPDRLVVDVSRSTDPLVIRLSSKSYQQEAR
ncbi:MAG: hypothetical protein H6835_04985 [Planctomycetes bacterium]|nr:hypothetical protein [Planctomycetota bacterium]